MPLTPLSPASDTPRAPTAGARDGADELGPVDALLFDLWRAEAATSEQRVLVIDAPQLALAVSRTGHDVLAWCDDLRDELVLADHLPVVGFDAEGFAGVTSVLMHLPKSLGALDEYASAIARWADPQVQVFAGAREKHLNRSMNQSLAAHFTDVSASRGRQKCRVLRAQSPIIGKGGGWPKSRFHPELGLHLCAHGGTFAGTSLDAGTKLLLQQWPRLSAGFGEPDRVVDLGCGNGVIAATAADYYPDAQVTGIDVTFSGVWATRATAARNELDIEVTRSDGLSERPDHSVDLLITNPPFHVGTSKDSAPTLAMFADAARVLRPGGQLWCVFNSHLPWLAELRRAVGRTEVIVQDRNYFVTRSVVR